MKNKNKLALLAGIAALLIVVGFGGWKYWKSHQTVQVERLALDGESSQKTITSLMNREYGNKHYNKEEDCWDIDHGGRTYCMKPLSLDRVHVDGEDRLYLFVGGYLSESSNADSEGLAGAFAFKSDGSELIAATRDLTYSSPGGAMPETVKLLQISRSGQMGWLIQSGGDLNEGYAFREPHLFVPKNGKVVDTAADLIGAHGSKQAALNFDYHVDASKTDSEYYPLLLTVRDEAKKVVASYRFQFDSSKWKYFCSDKTCGEQGSLPSSDDGDGESMDNDAVDQPAQPPANANAALFSDGTELSAADLKDVLAAVNAAFVVKDQQTWGFVTPECAKPFPLSAEVVKGYEDNRNMLWLQGGNSCTSGNTEHSIWLFIRGEDGHLRANLGLPAKQATVTDDATDGYHDIRLSGNGFCEAVWRWNGSQYAHLKNIATQPGGCGGE
ncbi:hypothetical protein [Chromobacterium vaccinii]|uniref:hypothetical protein n=1 Tax=Chromobacterium vaccinii TaxID=1108595 RepID=UPI000E15EBBF|nr:hypothetical protein [Chromobacterium vaccinii]SUX29453.1 Uncharacterised protein [Chromobacterium vaccinii]